MVRPLVFVASIFMCHQVPKTNQFPLVLQVTKACSVCSTCGDKIALPNGANRFFYILCRRYAGLLTPPGAGSLRMHLLPTISTFS
jgi:hypothetical protein